MDKLLPLLADGAGRRRLPFGRRLSAILKILLALLGVGDRRVAVVDLLVDADQLLDPAAALVLEVVPLPGRVVDRNRAMVAEANIVRRPRHSLVGMRRRYRRQLLRHIRPN